MPSSEQVTMWCLFEDNGKGEGAGLGECGSVTVWSWKIGEGKGCCLSEDWVEAVEGDVEETATEELEEGERTVTSWGVIVDCLWTEAVGWNLVIWSGGTIGEGGKLMEKQWIGKVLKWREMKGC